MNNPLFQDLLHAFDQYAQVQETHLRHFTHESRPDIEQLCFERARAFAELKNQLISLQQQPGKATDYLILLCQERLMTLKAQDDLLRERLLPYYKILQRQLTQLRQHKQALLSYGRAQGMSHPSRRG